jgi:hypothetical protein
MRGCRSRSDRRIAMMYVTLFFDQHNYEFNISLHSSRARAEAQYKTLLRHFWVKPNVGDDCGEAPHLYQIECDGELGEEIHLSDLAA